MNVLRNVLRILLPLIIVAAGGVATKLLIDAGKKPPTEPPPRALPLVETILTETSTWRPRIRANGTVQAAIESELVSEVQGRVIELGPGILAGARFQSGDLLVQIDRRDYAVALVEAQAAVAQAQLALELEQAEAEAARRAWDSLHPDDEPSRLVLREPQLAETRARVAAVTARAKAAQRDLDRTTIQAPFDGFTFRKTVELGQFVTRGMQLAHLLGRDAVEVRLPIQQTDLALLDLEARDGTAAGAVELHARLGGVDRTWHGFVVRRDDWLDPKTRMASIVVRVVDPYAEVDGRLPMFVNLFVEAELRGRAIDDVVVLPRSALRGDREVLVVDADDHLHVRQVVLVGRERDEIVVSTGLRAGERICITPLDVVTDGMRVRVMSKSAGEQR